MSDVAQYVGFMLGDEHYGVEIMGVKEIIRLIDITPVPKAPKFLEGIINLRGAVIPVVSLRKRLSMSTVPATEHTRIIVAHFDSRVLGFIVDSIEEVMRINLDDIESTPSSSSKDTEYIDGVAKMKGKMVILLNMVKIFSSEEQIELSKMF